VSECVSLVGGDGSSAGCHAVAPDDTPVAEPVHDDASLACPSTPKASVAANDHANGSQHKEGRGGKRPVKIQDDPSRLREHGRLASEAVHRPSCPRIVRYSPLGVPKPHNTARVVRMAERVRRELGQQQQPLPPYHPKHARPSLPTPEAIQAIKVGHPHMEYLVRDGAPEPLAAQVPQQAQRQAGLVGRAKEALLGHHKGHVPPKARHPSDRVIDAEFGRDVSQCLVVHGGRALGLEPSRCETPGLRALVEKNIQSFESQSDAMKLVGLLIAKKLNQITERWVG